MAGLRSELRLSKHDCKTDLLLGARTHRSCLILHMSMVLPERTVWLAPYLCLLNQAMSAPMGKESTMSDEVLASVSASAPRRVMGVAMLTGLGGVSLYVAGQGSASIGWTGFLVGVGFSALWLALRQWQATRETIELTASGLRSTEGVAIADVQDMVRVERGFAMLKPSNGFVLVTKTAAPRIWRPGLWWRLGRRIGIGGVTPGAQGKNMAEILAALIAQRDMSQNQ